MGLLNILLTIALALSVVGRSFIRASNQPVNVVTTTVIAAVIAAVTAMVVIWLLSIVKRRIIRH